LFLLIAEWIVRELSSVKRVNIELVNLFKRQYGAVTLTQVTTAFCSVLGIRIRRILMIFGLQDPDPLVRGTDPDPDPDPSLF
jgi:hypothetical protein